MCTSVHTGGDFFIHSWICHFAIYGFSAACTDIPAKGKNGRTKKQICYGKKRPHQNKKLPFVPIKSARNSSKKMFISIGAYSGIINSYRKQTAFP